MRWIILIAFLNAGFFSGCGLYKDGYKPSVLMEKKINQSRKAEISKGGKSEVIAIATHLNNVDSRIFGAGREYFFIEIFSEVDIPLVESLHFRLTNNVDFMWMREIEVEESDEILGVRNRWARGFLIAFDELEYQQKKNMKLIMEVENVGAMVFDFSYQVLEMRL
ncbi:hypothetical protein [Helicobacter sp. 23-1045]